MSYKVKEVARMVGVTVRMLHHYDDIGLLKPQSVSTAGYRLYSDSDLVRLQQILFFKELDFSLKQIKELMGSPHYNQYETLKSHRQLLINKRERLDKIISTVDRTIEAVKGGKMMSKNDMFKAFDMSEIERHKEQYAKETKERYGNSEAYRESEEKTASYSKEKWQEIQETGSKIFSKLATLMDRNPSDLDVQETIASYRQYITDNFYNCTPEIFRGLGDLYVADGRFTKNIDKHGEGLSAFMQKAMAVYCDNLTK